MSPPTGLRIRSATFFARLARPGLKDVATAVASIKVNSLTLTLMPLVGALKFRDHIPV
jgi:hypothetical protein